MKLNISPTIRISIGLIALTISLIMMAKVVGLVPDQRAGAIEARQKLCEALAIQLSLASGRKELRIVHETLDAVVDRNSELLSAALRDRLGNIIAAAGDHATHWVPESDDQSTETHVQVPIFQNGRRTGAVEISFTPLDAGGFLANFRGSLAGLIAFLVVAGFIGYFLLLRRALRELDPAGVIPERVRAAFDALTEGVLIMDQDEQIMLANASFARLIEKSPESLIGCKVSELSWHLLESQEGSEDLPWQRAMHQRVTQVGSALNIRTSSGEQRTFMVNGAPITDAEGKLRGALATFDDVTDLEKKNTDLKLALLRLEQSKSKVNRQNRELRYLASRDSLTGCLNRRAFFEHLEELVAAARQTGESLCCLMIDIDNFKLINDRYGHATGDKVIGYVAEAMESASREEDVVCRYGGEEFCLLLPGLTIDAGEKIAERIRQSITDHSRARFTSPMSITVSVGVADLSMRDEGGQTLIHRADEALYSAKESGRNQVIRWRETEARAATAIHTFSTQTLLATGEKIDNRQPDSQATEETLHVLQQKVAELESILEEQTLNVHQQHGFDRVTGLSNRVLFFDRVSQSIARARRNETCLAILYMDVDLFRRVNDAFGPAVGDRVLRTVGERISEVLRESDTVAALGGPHAGTAASRLGNDEFAIQLADLDNADSVTWIIQRLLESLTQKMTIEGHDIYITSSIGVSVYPNDGMEAETLVRNARIARQHAREDMGCSTYVFYSSEMNDRSYRQLMLEAQIRHAIDRDEFSLHYQPRIDLRTGDVVSMEALIRWRHPEMGMVPPDTFIPIAERAGLIQTIGSWVLRAACRQAKLWNEAGGNFRMAVNLSAVQLRSPSITDDILSIVADAGLEPHQLELEITETALMQNVESSATILKELHSQGIHVAVDDFGTGYSSLNYLKRFSIDTLKVDRSFVRDITLGSSDATVVAAIIAMAHRMGIRVVAEGVETEAQHNFLRNLQCDEVQGYLFARPMPVDESTEWLQSASQEGGITNALRGQTNGGIAADEIGLDTTNVISIMGDRSKR